MVFESVVTDVLNRFLGDYIENLDSKQLKLGIWGGDVVLTNLILKQSALKELDLPIQTIYGRLEKLVVKIPWKNLYGASVEASIEGLYLLLAPNNQIEYNAEREEKRAWETKKSKLQQIEDAKKLQEVKAVADDTFVEKLVTQIIKNVQLSIKNIHVRYEDRSLDNSFGMGCTLSNLQLQTTDESWKPTVVQEMVTQIFKVVSLEGLAVYWNCGTKMYTEMSETEIWAAFQRDIANREFTPQHFNYILGPINSDARLKLNPKPEQNTPAFSIPKAHAELKIETLSIGIAMCQYRDIIAFADSMTSQTLGMPYRKYRPHLPYKGHAKEWWQFAITCVLETEVKRRTQNWNWNHMCDHRHRCNQYAELYKSKLTAKKVQSQLLEDLENLEKNMDLFNLVLIRQRIALEVERIVKSQQAQASKGWFGGWFGGSKAEELEKDATILQKFQHAMTTEEKQKLFNAIDYKENMSPTQYPDEFVDTVVKFHLQKFEIDIQNNSAAIQSVAKFSLSDVKSSIERRPKKDGLKVAVFVGNLTVYGVEQGDIIPQVISSNLREDISSGYLLDFLYEMNPLDLLNGHRIVISANPIRVVYDAKTISEVLNVFTVPSSTALEDLQNATFAQFQSLKGMSALGMQNLIEKRTKVDLRVKLAAPLVLLPYDGFYRGSENILVLNLGTLNIKSLLHDDIAEVHDLLKAGFTKTKVMNELILRSYDRFQLELTEIQVLIAQGDEDWEKNIIKESIEHSSTPLHLLNPLNVSVLFENCIVGDDPSLPKINVTAEISNLCFHVTDARLLLLVTLINSVPKDFGGSDVDQKLASGAAKIDAIDIIIPDNRGKSLKTTDYEEIVQLTNIKARFELKELEIKLSHQETVHNESFEVSNLKLNSLTCSYQDRTFDKRISIGLQRIVMDHCLDGETINIINTNLDNTKTALFKMEFNQVDKSSPDFVNVYDSTLATLTLNFAMIKLTVHQEVLVDFLKFVTDLQNSIEDSSPQVPSGTSIKKASSMTSLNSAKFAVTNAFELQKKNLEKKHQSNLTTFRLRANLSGVLVEFIQKVSLSKISIADISSEIIVNREYTKICTYLNDISAIDLHPKTYYPNILSSYADQKAIDLDVIIYNKSTADNPDIAVIATLGRLKIHFVNRYFANLINFINSFQAAREAIADASEKAAQSAKENMQNIYEKATKVSLSVKISAPNIVVPEKSTSTTALSLDLGFITLSNKFNTLTVANEHGQKAIVDSMDMKLESLAIENIKLDTNNTIVSKESILEPLTFSFHIIRNLSSWYNAIPDIDVKGSIDSINVQMAQSDYSTIMKILSENLNEGTIVHYEDADRTMQDVEVMTDNILTSPSIKDIDSDIEVAEEPSEFVKTMFRWDFTMKFFKINLFLMEEFKSTRINLAELSVEGLSVKGRMLSNNTLQTAVLLMNVVLTDTRPNNNNVITRYLCRTEELTRSDKNMVDLTYQTLNTDTFIDLRVYSFTFLISAEYLMVLSKFFDEKHEDQGKMLQKKPSTNLSKKKVEAASNTGSMLSVSIKLEKPDIILVENMAKFDTRALILNCELLMKIRLVGTRQTINGTLGDLQMYTCVFDPLIRNSTKNMFLEPLTISIAGSTPPDKGLHIEAYVSTVYVSVTVYTIELLNNIMQTLSTPKSVTDEQSDALQDRSGLWDIHNNREHQFWFLNDIFESAEDALETINQITDLRSSVLSEMCIFQVSDVVITLQSGQGNKTFPMLVIESSFKGVVNNWSSQISIEASLSLQMGYYNSLLALWEPLIEPVFIKDERGNTKYEPWKINLEVSMSEQKEQVVEADEDEPAPSPNMSIDISSHNNLEVTVTKTGIEVLQNLGKMFAKAVETVRDEGGIESQTLYKVVNTIGTDIKLHLGSSDLCMKENASATEIILQTDAEVNLDAKEQAREEKTGFLSNFNSIVNEKFLTIEIPKYSARLELPYTKSNSRYFEIKDKNHNGLVSTVTIINGLMVLTLRSILQVKNHFTIPIDIYYMRATNELERVATINPGANLNVPMHAVYSPTAELFFSVEGYSITSVPYVWKELQLNLAISKNLTCSSRNTNNSFVIKAVGEMEQIYYENTNKHTMLSTSYNISLRPAIIFKNSLPYDVVVCVADATGTTVKPGDSLELPNIVPDTTYLVVKLEKYLDKLWSCRRQIESAPQDFSVWTLDSHDSIRKMFLDLGMHCVELNGSSIMTLYCPFWMINKTGLMLHYRSSDENINVLHHPPFYKEPILFSFNAKNFFGKKKACVKIDQGEWSDKFSIDVAGSSGVVMCKDEIKYNQIGVSNSLTSNGLSKQITFTPYFVVINLTKISFECQEAERPADPWTLVGPNSCAAFWPHNELDDKLIRVRILDTDEVTAPFLITESHTTLLKLNNKYGGINVDIQLTEGAVYINLSLYDDGMAPVLIINDTKHTMNIWEKKSIQIRKLPPEYNMYFTWEFPCGERILVWEGGFKNEYENDLRMDGAGNYAITKQESVFWVSFLNGMQRVLLFTSSSDVAANVQSLKSLENIDKEITISIYGMGLSLVNNLKRQEIFYAGIASTGIIWETCKLDGKRYKQMNSKDNLIIEKAYQMHLMRPHSAVAELFEDNSFNVDFKEMMMTKPRRRFIRRRFQTGIWLQMKTSEHQMQIHAKINRLQLDNQLFDCTFPVVLAPVPPPKTVGSTDAHKPFAEVSIVQLLMKNSTIQQYKYFTILIQEFHVKVDLAFINALMEVFDTTASSEEEEKRFLEEDIKKAQDPLYNHVSAISMQEQKSFYDLLHFSPLKVHVSFSMASGQGIGNMPQFLSVLLQGIGVTLTDLQDVVFKLAYFQREYSFLTQRQLIREATTHYLGQTVKQLYVLVLGLDVIGNPYGLVIGITKGVEDLFYEPFQGAIQGPGEFAEGLALGVASLFGHTVGGAAGAVSKITGAMGKGIAALTFDKDYQRKRRDQINKRPNTVTESVARSSKGLVMGVVDGFTGVFTKPITGAKEQGVGGFFKGLGKGAVGLVTRPTAGVMDFASSSLDSVKRVADFGQEYVNRLRYPRFVLANYFVKPYDPDLAFGHKLLCELEKGKYYSTDVYSSHYVIVEKKEILLLSDKRMAYIVHNDLFGGWQLDWSYTWIDFCKVPDLLPKGIQLFFSGGKKGGFKFKSVDNSKVIVIPNEATCKALRENVIEHMESSGINGIVTVRVAQYRAGTPTKTEQPKQGMKANVKHIQGPNGGKQIIRMEMESLWLKDLKNSTTVSLPVVKGD